MQRVRRILPAAFAIVAVIGTAGDAIAASAAAKTNRLVAVKPATASVTASVEALRKAMLGADKKRLETLMSPRVSFGHSNGVVQTRGQFVDAVVTRKEVFKTIRLSKRAVRVTGETAVVRQNFAADLDLEGKPLSVKLDELQVWRRSAGKWQLLARQAFKR